MKYKFLLYISLVLLNSIKCEQIDLTIQDQEGGGFFCELHKVVQNIIHYHDQLVNLHIDWTNEFFPYKDSPTENGWDLFFEPIKMHRPYNPSETLKKMTISSSATFHELHDQVCTCPWVESGYAKYYPYRKYINFLLTEYVKIKPHIITQMTNFYDKHMKNHVCIGVHARIAKQHRALIPGKQIPQFNDYFEEIDQLLEHYKNEKVKIFVASDSHMGINAFREKYGNKVVYINAYRSPQDNDPCLMFTSGEQLKQDKELWHRVKHKTFGGISTLIDCLLLSKCDHMIHTTSNLAFFATYYNPDLKTIYLPKSVQYEECRFKFDPELKNSFLNP